MIVHGIDSTISVVQPGEKVKRTGWGINFEIAREISFAFGAKIPPGDLLVFLSHVQSSAIVALLANMQLDTIFIQETRKTYITGLFKMSANQVVATFEIV